MADAGASTEGQKTIAIRAYKELLHGYIAKRPSGLRKRISDAIGSNRSFVSHITSPKYTVPIPTHYVHKIIEVCHLSPVERAEFLAAYLTAHPGQSDLLDQKELNSETSITIDLSSVQDEQTRLLIKQALQNQAEVLIALAKTEHQKDE